MQQKPAQELVRADSHFALFVAVSVILPPKRNLIVCKRDEAVVGDGNAMGVTSKILENVRWPPERPFGVHNPVFPEELSQELPEQLRIGHTAQGTVKAELVRPE
jgi:hypothetical protein